MKKADKGGFQKIHKNQAAILEKIRDLIVPHYAQNWRKKMQIQGQIKWLLDKFA